MKIVVFLLLIICTSSYAQTTPPAQDTIKKHTLPPVTVTPRKPLVIRKSDRYIVDVEHSYLANGNSALDVLQKSPGLWVGGNGSIRIRGNQSVTVMINDVLQRMSEQELADYLRTLRSEDIAKIEIIPNPPSEYEAASTGGIVHIILKKSRREGLTGTLYSQYKQQGNRPYASGGMLLDFKADKFYLFGGLSYTHDRSQYHGYNNVIYPDKSTLYNDGTRNNNNNRKQYRIGLVYDISSNHSINVQTNASGNHLDQYFYSDIIYTGPVNYAGTASTQWLRKPRINSTTLQYNWKTDTMGSQFKAIADYTGSKKSETNTLSSIYSDAARNSLTRTNTPSTTEILSFQADYNKVITTKASFKTGIKYVGTTRNNTIITEDGTGGNWVIDYPASNNFDYDERLLMFYSSFERSFDKINIKGGLRGEQTWSEGHSVNTDEYITRKYFSLFPALFITRTLNQEKGNSLHLNYSRRVKRPGFNDLNPYRLRVHDFTVLTGNPDLLPQYAHYIEAGYVLLNNYSADINYQLTSDYIAQTATTLPGGVIEYKSKNFRNSKQYGLSVSAPFEISKSWSINNSFQLYHFEADFNEYTLSRTSFNVKAINNIRIKKIAELDIISEFVSPYLTANSRQSEIFYMDIGMTRKMLKDKFRLRLYFSDIFNTSREKELTQYDNTRIDFYQKRPTRTAAISITYNFNAGKAFQKKKIDQNNSDEKNRLGN